MSFSAVVLVRIRASNGFRRTIARDLGLRGIAKDEDVTRWAEEVLQEAMEGLLEAEAERKMNRR
jgi:hypothetical protein